MIGGRGNRNTAHKYSVLYISMTFDSIFLSLCSGMTGEQKKINARTYVLRSVEPDLLKHVKQENQNRNLFSIMFFGASKGSGHFVGA